MKTFQEFLEQVGSPSMQAKKELNADLSKQRAMQRIRQGFWRQREAIRTKHRQDAEMHADAERMHALP